MATFQKRYFTHESQHHTLHVEMVKLLSHLTVDVISATWFDCTEKWQLDWRQLSNSYWTLVTAGSGILLFGEEKKRYKIAEGDFILFPEFCQHSIRPDKNCKMSMINIHFHAKVYNSADILKLLGIGGVYKQKQPESCLYHSQEAAREYDAKPPLWQRSLNNRVEIVLAELLRQYAPTKLKSSNEYEQLLRLRPVLELITEELSNPNLSTQDLANKLGISDVYLRILFRKQIGISPIKYVNRKRINHACVLLQTTMLPIKEIANKCGFREVQFFYRVFHNHIATTPAAYRQNPIF